MILSRSLRNGQSLVSLGSGLEGLGNRPSRQHTPQLNGAEQGKEHDAGSGDPQHDAAAQIEFCIYVLMVGCEIADEYPKDEGCPNKCHEGQETQHQLSASRHSLTVARSGDGGNRGVAVSQSPDGREQQQ